MSNYSGVFFVVCADFKLLETAWNQISTSERVALAFFFMFVVFSGRDEKKSVAFEKGAPTKIRKKQTKDN